MLEAKHGLYRPWLEPFWGYLTDISQGNFGWSLYTSEQVWHIDAAKMPYTLAVGALALLLAIVIGLRIGLDG